MMKLAEKLFELRKEKGWSQEKLAEQIMFLGKASQNGSLDKSFLKSKKSLN